VLSIGLKEETLASRIRGAMQDKADAEQAVHDVEETLRALAPDPEAADRERRC